MTGELVGVEDVPYNEEVVAGGGVGLTGAEAGSPRHH